MLYEGYLSGLVFLISFQFLNTISPGPTMALVIRNSLYARKKGMETAFGVFLGSFFVKALSIFGLAILIEKTPWLLFLIQTLGGGYLLIVGMLSFQRAFYDLKLKHHSAYPLEKNPGLEEKTSPLVSGFLVNTINPLNALGFLAIFSTAIDSFMPLTVQLSYVVILSLVSFAVFAVIAFFFSDARVQTCLSKYTCLLNFLTGLAMIYWGLAVWGIKLIKF